MAGLVLCLLILTGCAIEAGSHGLAARPTETGGPAPIGHIAFQPPLLPITFSIDVEEFRFHESSEEAEVDLERSRSGTETDLAYDHITGELKPIHGAKVSVYSTYSWTEPDTRNDYPGEKECLETPDENWKDSFSTDDLENKYIIACIKTVEGDLGFLLISPDTAQKPVAYYVYTHTWVR